MKKILREFPPTWGDNLLTEHIDGAINNIATTTVFNQDEYPLLILIDHSFQQAVSALKNPPALYEGFLLMRCHAAFRAASLLSMAGQNIETFPVVRCCLENAMYALHINKNPGNDDVWMNRHRGDEALKKAKKAFGYSSVYKTFEKIDLETAKVADMLYQRAIDFGAHPNERATTGSMTIKVDGKTRYFTQDYLSGGTQEQRHSLRSAAQTGLCALIIFQTIFPDIFREQHITEAIESMKTVL